MPPAARPWLPALIVVAMAALLAAGFYLRAATRAPASSAPASAAPGGAGSATSASSGSTGDGDRGDRAGSAAADHGAGSARAPAPLGAVDPRATAAERPPALGEQALPADALDAPWPTAPDAYQLSTGYGRALVNLGGGPPHGRPVARGAGDLPSRSLRGVVIDARGAPVPGAIVLAGTALTLLAGDLIADAGVVTDDAGAFALDELPADARVALALTPAAWSTPLALTEQVDGVTLVIGAPSALEGTVRRAGRPVPATLTVGLRALPLHLMTASDTAGHFQLLPLPPGSYELTVAAGAHSDRAIPHSAAVTVALDVGVGQTVRHDVELPVGGAVRARVVGAQPGLARVAYWLFPGAAEIASAEFASAGGDAGAIEDGATAATPHVFSDCAPGAYTACAEVVAAGGARSFGCATVIAGDGATTVDVAIPVSPPLGPAAPGR